MAQWSRMHDLHRRPDTVRTYAINADYDPRLVRKSSSPERELVGQRHTNSTKINT